MIIQVLFIIKILTPSGYPPTGKVFGALIHVLNMPYDLVDQMHLPYTQAHARARLVRDHTFEMDLLTWERVHEAKDEDQMQERGKAEKQRMKATKNASKGNGSGEFREPCEMFGGNEQSYLQCRVPRGIPVQAFADVHSEGFEFAR